jgi:dimethylargininase
MFTHAIIRPPAPNFAKGLTTAALGAPNYERALEQHAVYCSALEQCGLALIRLEADEEYPDSCFVEDTAILVGAGDGAQAIDARHDDVESQTRALTEVVPTEPQAILARPGARSRAGEVRSIRKVLADLFPALSEIHSPGTLDGGDVCQAGKHFFIGVSSRTNEAGAQQLAELLASLGYTTSMVDTRFNREMKSVPGAIVTGSTSPRILHLKSGLAYLGNNRLVVTEALAGRAEFSAYDLIPVNPDEEYAANCVRVNDHVLIALGSPAFEKQLLMLGYQTIVLGLTEFQKMDGGLSCLSLRF